MVASHRNEQAQAFAERLARALLDNGKKVSATALARDFNLRWRGAPISVNATRKWLTGQSVPSMDKLVVLSALLGVSHEWLRWGESLPASYREKGKTSISGQFHVRDAARPLPTAPAIQDYLLLTSKHKRLVDAVVETLLREQYHANDPKPPT